MEPLSSKCKTFLVGSIRKAYRFYSVYRKDCIKVGKCVKCGKGNVKADHIDPVGRFIPEDNPYLVRMFCDRENLQPLCDLHHDEKTASERKARSKNRTKKKAEGAK